MKNIHIFHFKSEDKNLCERAQILTSAKDFFKFDISLFYFPFSLSPVIRPSTTSKCAKKSNSKTLSLSLPEQKPN